MESTFAWMDRQLLDRIAEAEAACSEKTVAVLRDLRAELRRREETRTLDPFEEKAVVWLRTIVARHYMAFDIIGAGSDLVMYRDPLLKLIEANLPPPRT